MCKKINTFDILISLSLSLSLSLYFSHILISDTTRLLQCLKQKLVVWLFSASFVNSYITAIVNCQITKK